MACSFCLATEVLRGDFVSLPDLSTLQETHEASGEKTNPWGLLQTPPCPPLVPYRPWLMGLQTGVGCWGWVRDWVTRGMAVGLARAEVPQAWTSVGASQELLLSSAGNPGGAGMLWVPWHCSITMGSPALQGCWGYPTIAEKPKVPWVCRDAVAAPKTACNLSCSV